MAVTSILEACGAGPSSRATEATRQERHVLMGTCLGYVVSEICSKLEQILLGRASLGGRRSQFLHN